MSCYPFNFFAKIFSLEPQISHKNSKNKSKINDLTVSNTNSLQNILKDLDKSEFFYTSSKFEQE